MITACHDCADGGLLVALAEMCFGGVGASVVLPEGHAVAGAFGGDQARYVLAASAAHAAIIPQRAAAGGIVCMVLGRTQHAALRIDGHGSIALGELTAAQESWLPAYMAA